MRKVVIALASIVVSMVTEVMLRRLAKADEANVAEAEAIRAAVALGMEAAAQVQLPVYLLPIKMMVVNEAVLGQLAKFLFDEAEAQVKALLDSLDGEKLAALKSDMA